MGFIVPASTFTYGSILMEVTSNPRDCKIFPIDEDATPLPTPDITPPTMKIYLWWALDFVGAISPTSLHEIKSEGKGLKEVLRAYFGFGY